MPSASLSIVNNPPDCVPRDAGEAGAAPSPSLTSLLLQTPESPCLISCHSSIRVSNETSLSELLIHQWRDTHNRVIVAQCMQGREVSYASLHILFVLPKCKRWAEEEEKQGNGREATTKFGWSYYGLNVCVSPKFIWLSPNSQCDGVWK